MKRILGIALILSVTSVFGCEKEQKAKKDDDKSERSQDDDDDKSKKDDDDDGGKKKDKKKADDDGGKDGKTVAAAAVASGATAHLARNCEVVGRLDMKRLLEAAPVKTHVVPVLEEAKAKEPKSDDDKRFKALLDETGIDPLKDIHEIAICAIDVKAATGPGGKPAIALIFGGNFKPNTIVPALLKHGTKEKLTETDIGGVKALHNAKEDVFIGQASDGVVIIGISRAPFEQAIGTSDAASSTFQLPVDQALTLVIPAATMKTAMVAAGPNNPFKDQTDKIGRAAISFDVTAAQLQVRIASSDEKSAIELGGQIKLLINEATKNPPRPGDPTAGLMQALKEAKVSNEGKELVVKLDVPRDQLELAAKEMATNLRAKMSK